MKSNINRLTREAILKNAPKELEGEALESWWIARGIQDQLAAEADPDAGVPDPETFQRLARSVPAKQREVVAECRQAIVQLKKHLAPDDIEDSCPYWSALWGNDDAHRALAYLTDLVDYLEEHQRPMPKRGNIKRRRGMLAARQWPLLRELGYSMRAASRILSQACIEAGIESDDTQESIYQAIRNASR